MGLSISYPPDDYLPAVEDNMGRLFIRSLRFNDMEADVDSPWPLLCPAFGSGKLIIEGSLSFKKREADDNVQTETMLSIIRSPKPEREGGSINRSAATATAVPSMSDCPSDSPVIGIHSLRHRAVAVRLQKVYKSFRTRRQLGDCAILVEQRKQGEGAVRLPGSWGADEFLDRTSWSREAEGLPHRRHRAAPR